MFVQILNMNTQSIGKIITFENALHKWARFQLEPNQTVKPWFNGLLVPKKCNGLVWFTFSINGPVWFKTQVYRLIGLV